MKTSIAALFFLVLSSPLALAQTVDMSDQVIFGIKVKAGARYDDVRMCVATDPGVKGGPAVDITFFTEVGLSRDLSLLVDIPVMRPLLFWAAFDMLQWEPDVTLNFRVPGPGDNDLVVGPSLGMVFHYGPDYRSGETGDARGPSFFAMGPKLGGYLGLDFVRPGEAFNFQLGISPYVAPLFSIDDPQDHQGVVLGGSLDALLRFQ